MHRTVQIACKNKNMYIRIREINLYHLSCMPHKQLNLRPVTFSAGTARLGGGGACYIRTTQSICIIQAVFDSPTKEASCNLIPLLSVQSMTSQIR